MQPIQPIGPYLTNGRSVIGSDDNLKFPIWDMSRQCIRTMLEGGSADLAVSHMEGLTEAWNNEKQGMMHHEKGTKKEYHPGMPIRGRDPCGRPFIILPPYSVPCGIKSVTDILEVTVQGRHAP